MLVLKPHTEDLKASSEFANIYDTGNYGKNVLNVPHSEYIDFIRIGKLCELVFVRYLREKGIAIDAKDILKPEKEERRIGPDFILPSKQEVDVKAANKPFHSRLLVREDQFRAHIHDIYIGAKYIDDERIEFWGYVLGNYLKKVSPADFGTGPCRHIFLSDLEPIEKFIEYCKNKQVVT